MARHRDIRNMDYSEDYDGYDDVYGHSVDDDFYISPSNRQFLYNREPSRSSEGDIKEEDESEAELSDIDRAKLASCIDQIKQIIGSISISRNDLVNIIIQQKFDIQKSISVIMDDSLHSAAPEKDYIKQNYNVSQSHKFDIHSNINETKKQFTIPNIFNKSHIINESPKLSNPFISDNSDKSKFTVPKLNSGITNYAPKFTIPKFTIPKLNENSHIASLDSNKIIDSIADKKQFGNLSDLVSTHLKINSVSPPIDFKTQLKFLHKNKPETLEITPKLGKMSISESRSSCDMPDKTETKFQIDLSVALKNTISAPLISTKEKENFQIPFIDCEPLELRHKKEALNKELLCTLNMKNVKNLKLTSEKKKSFFGRVICRNYKRYVKQIMQEKINLNNIKRFDFSSVSPDSKIIGYLKRK